MSAKEATKETAWNFMIDKGCSRWKSFLVKTVLKAVIYVDPTSSLREIPFEKIRRPSFNPFHRQGSQNKLFSYSPYNLLF